MSIYAYCIKGVNMKSIFRARFIVTCQCWLICQC